MRQFSKGIELYEDTVRFFEEEQTTAVQGHAHLADAAYDDWIQLVSGGLTPAQTKGAFARGDSAANSTPIGRRRDLSPRMQAAVGTVPLLPVNVQSARLLHSISKREAPAIHSASAWDVGPDNLVGNSVWRLVPEGTKKMVASGIWKEIERRWKARNKAFFDAFSRRH